MIENKTFSDFTGGVNYTDPELNMKEKYFVLARNVELVYDSTIKKRNGFKLVKNLYSEMEEDTSSCMWWLLLIREEFLLLMMRVM